MESGKYQYYAFISHKSSDTAYALKMQKFIESYRLPAEAREKKELPKHLSPLCAYEVDFSCNPLQDEMEDKLRRSKFLILLCSKELMRQGPKYVDFEVQTFIRCRLEEGVDPCTRIIPIILDGEFDSPENECCPEALKAMGDKRPIAMDRNKCKNDREVFLRAISGMLDIDYAVLENRDKKRRRRQTRWICAAAAAALAAMGCLAEYFIPRRAHYVDYVMQHGLPVGIERLSGEKAQAVPHYVITRCRHRITELLRVNECGNPIDYENNWYYGDRAARYTFDYNTAGDLSAVTYYNKDGRAYFTLQYSGGLQAADLKNAAFPDRAHYVPSGYEKDAAMLLADGNEENATEISRFKYEYTDGGYVKKILFQANSAGLPAQDGAVYGFEYEVDGLGRIQKKYFLDAMGQRRVNSEGVFCKEYVYENSDLVQLVNYGTDGEMTKDQNGIASLKRTFDDRHRVVLWEIFDENGAPSCGEYGFAVQEDRYEGNVQISRFYGTDGAPITEESFCGLKTEYDENGYLCAKTTLDADENPVTDPEVGYATVTYVNDETGKAVQTQYLDEAGALVNNAHGYGEKLTQYNDRGQETRVSYYEASGEPADFKGLGYSILVNEYDAYGRETSTRMYDGNENPVTATVGYHGFDTKYEDGAAEKITRWCYDADHNLVNADLPDVHWAAMEAYYQNGIATKKLFYDQDRNLMSEVETVEEYSATGERMKFAQSLQQEQGQISCLDVGEVYDTSGILAGRIIDKYLFEEETTLFAPETGRLASHWIYLYEEGTGRLLSMECTLYDEAGQPETKAAELYHADGYLEKETMWWVTDGLERETEKTYDADGRLLSEMIKGYREDGSALVSQTVYGENGQEQTSYYELPASADGESGAQEP